MPQTATSLVFDIHVGDNSS